MAVTAFFSSFVPSPVLTLKIGAVLVIQTFLNHQEPATLYALNARRSVTPTVSFASNRPRWAKERLFEISRKNLSGYFESEIPRKNLFGDLEMGAPGERVGMRAHVRASARACERGIA